MTKGENQPGACEVVLRHEGGGGVGGPCRAIARRGRNERDPGGTKPNAHLVAHYLCRRGQSGWHTSGGQQTAPTLPGS